MQVSPHVARLLDRLQATRWQYYNLHPASAEMLFLLAKLSQARRVVEVGTSNGYSAIVLGEAVRAHGGTVTTIERDGEVAEEAQANIAAAELSEVVTVVPGSAYKVLKSLPGPWDFAFLDATKQEYVGYLERILPKFAPRALLVADNLLSHADELREFRASVAAEPRMDATVLPIGTGLLVGLYDAAPVAAASRETSRVAAAAAPALRRTRASER